MITAFKTKEAFVKNDQEQKHNFVEADGIIGYCIFCGGEVVSKAHYIKPKSATIEQFTELGYTGVCSHRTTYDGIRIIKTKKQELIKSKHHTFLCGCKDEQECIRTT